MMGSIEISFLGVCTIFRNLPNFVPPDSGVPANRIVLARATQAFIDITHVDPHIAKLQLPTDDVVFSGPPLPPASPPAPGVFSLDGVGLKIVNATETGLQPDRGLDCLPSLSAFLDEPIGLPAAAVYLPDPELVQAWFDVPGGRALSYLMRTFPPCPTVPSITVLTMETEGPPILEYQPWNDVGPTQVVFTGATPRINVMNFALGEGVVDDNADFMLNYQLLDPTPSPRAIQIPRANACTQQSPATYLLPRCGDAGPGCSNTNYP